MDEAVAVEGTDDRASIRTFLIADIRGYSTFTRERGDEAAARLAKRFADLARDSVEARAGMVIELRGDEALAVFDMPEEAVLAALEFQEACREASIQDPELSLPVGVGIDAGEAVPVEDGYRGRALNMAARLCAKAAAGQVLVSREVGEALDANLRIRFHSLGRAELKGFEGSIELLEVIATGSGPPFAPRLVHSTEPFPPELDADTQIVGREHELRWLRGTWRQVRRGRGRILFVSGPTGIGKTGLASDLAAWVHGEGGTVRYCGAGGAGAAIALAEVETARTAEGPTLLVLDELHLFEEVAQAVCGAVEEVAVRPVLVLGLFRSVDGQPALARLVERADPRGDGHRRLAALGPEDVRVIIRQYAGDAAVDAPFESILRSSAGVPARVHEIASEWARDESGRRLAAAAEVLAQDRARQAEGLAFANTVIGLKLDRIHRSETRAGLSDVCPYRGLGAFEEGDAAYFYGRERLIGELAARTVGVGLLGLVGPSGSGKSSVVMAGLLPSLAAGLLPGSDRWRQATMRPGEHPIKQLDAALGAGGSDRLVLVVDQFEEVFTATRDERERKGFLQHLVELARDPERAVVVLTIRSDLMGRCALYGEFADLLAQNLVMVGPMTADELRRAIELPARRVGLRVESLLTEKLLSDVADEPGALPLLSTALVELWQARTEGWLRAGTYERTGGVRGAVARLAEESFGRLEGPEREAARAVLLRLAQGEGDALARRRVPVAEFQPDRDQIRAVVLDRFTQDRLLTKSDGTIEVAHEALLSEWPRLREWLEEDAQGRQLRLHLTEASRQWEGSDREPGELYRGARLSATLDWSTLHGRELNDLEREFLAESRDVSEREAQRQRRTNRRLQGLLVGVVAFLALSLVAGSLALVQGGRAQQEARTARQAATVALSQSLGAQAVSEPRLDVAMLLAREAVALDPSFRARSDLLATLLRVPSVLRALHGPPTRNVDVAVSPNGQTVALADQETVLESHGSGVVLEDASTGRRIGTLPEPFPVHVAFAPDGSLLVNTGRGIKVYDPSTLTETGTISLPTSLGRSSISGGPDFGGGRMVVAARSQGPSSPSSLVQFVYETGKLAGPTIPAPGGTPAVAYVPGARRLLASVPGRTTVFDARTGRQVRSYPVGSAVAALSPDGRTVALGGEDGSVRFLDLTSGRVVLGIGSHPGGVSEVGFTPDGQTMISSGNDGKTLLWDVSTHTVRQTLAGHAGPIRSQAVSQDGSTLYTGSTDGNALAWDLTGLRGFAPSFVAARTNPSFQTGSLAISPDSATIAVGNTSGVVNLWDATTLRRVGSFQAVPGVVAALSFSPDGRSLLVAGDTPEPQRAWLRIWQLGTHPRLIRSMGPAVPVITNAAFSPDGTTVAATGRRLDQDFFDGGEVAEWNAGTGMLLAPPTVTKGETIGLAFAPGGTTVAVSGANSLVEVLDPATANVESRFSVGGPVTLSVAFSRDGSTLATAGFDGSVRLWDPETGKMIGSPIQASGTALDSVAWSPDGRTIATTEVSGTDVAVRLLDVATRREVGPPFLVPAPGGAPVGVSSVAFTLAGSDAVVTTTAGRAWIFPATLQAWGDRACTVANRNFTRAEWTEFLPGRPYQPVCPAAATG